MRSSAGSQSESERLPADPCRNSNSDSAHRAGISVCRFGQLSTARLRIDSCHKCDRNRYGTARLERAPCAAVRIAATRPRRIDTAVSKFHITIMKLLILSLTCCALASSAQQKEYVGKAQPGAVLEHFTLNGGRAYDGIWDSAKSQIHIVVKSNHVANLAVSKEEIVSRKAMGDGSQVKLYSDVDTAEKVLLLNRQNYQAAQTRLATANQRRDTLHQTYKGKNLPNSTYTAVMAQYKAADDEVARAGQAVDAARTGFGKSLEAYQRAGGKTAYTLP
jgi:outer membrane murein-binding lipoprotein Lpp